MWRKTKVTSNRDGEQSGGSIEEAKNKKVVRYRKLSSDEWEEKLRTTEKNCSHKREIINRRLRWYAKTVIRDLNFAPMFLGERRWPRGRGKRVGGASVGIIN